MSNLLTREQFRTRTLARNQGQCVVPSCPEAAVDAHHTLNRNLFTQDSEFGGYFFENGSGLCSGHHLDAERTLIATTDLYLWCQVERLLPIGFDPDYEYDTWGNIVISEHERIAGPMFENEGCQKALGAAGVLWMFS